MKVLGITGNSGTGKTKISKIISKQYNAKIIDADEIAKSLSKKGTKYFEEIVNCFGTEIICGNGELNRVKLAKIVFNSKEKMNILNEITEKYVVEEIIDEIEKYSKIEKLVVIDVPLLFESKLNEKCEKTIGIIAPKKIKIERICERDFISEEAAEERLSAQKSDEFFMEKCDYIITNDGDIEKVKNQIDLIFNEAIEYKNLKSVRYIKFKKLSQYQELEHAFVIKPLDFKTSDNLEKNYEKICEVLKIKTDTIVKPIQTHTDNVCVVDNEKGIHPKELKNVDGLITNKKEKVLSLIFADCTPIYLYDPVSKVIANIHSGWKGTLQKIAQKAVIKMQENFACNPANIVCVLGPTIHKCHFEVDEDVNNLFKKQFEYTNKWNEISKKNEHGKYYIDTILINKIMLTEAGLKEENIVDSGICTVCNNKIMHSFRAQKENSGRNTSLIYLK